MMRVLKRDNTYEPISFDKVLRRIRNLCQNLKGVSPDEIAQKVCVRIYDGVKTSELDELAAQLCASLLTTHPDYGFLASRIIISNHHKNTSPSFSETMGLLFNAKDVHGVQNSLISQELWDIVKAHKSKLNSVIDYQRDFLFDYFGFKTLERSYLLKVDGKIVERPQHMWMRVALGIHGSDIKEALETYELMSQRYFTHATPTLFNAGTPRAQLASCFLLGTHDSITGIFKTVTDSAQISKYAGGIGIHIHDIRATGSHIRGTNGNSTGIIPMLRVFNNTARYVNQGGKRNGSIAMYLEPWHADIEAFLDIRKNHGSEEDRCRDLFTAMWIPDLFMKRVQENGEWSLMCPDESPGLSDAVGEEFQVLYEKYEAEGKFRKKIKAQQLWMAMLKSQIETGTPYLCYKDAANKKTNQKNLGTIKSSNLCVAPETKILTNEGYQEIRTLENKEVSVWNGVEWSKTTVQKTNESAELIRITFSEGSVLECTPYHKFHIQTKLSQEICVNAQDLTLGMQLIEWTSPDNIIYKNTIQSIEKTGRKDATYCFNEPKRHMGIFNGVITGNCSEILEYSNQSSYATCNLASIALPSYIAYDGETGVPYYDFKKLHDIAQVITRNINKVIDRTFYPVPETESNNKQHRPIGIGVQGLANTFALMRMPFDSPEAAQLNKDIFETIYHGALTASMLIAKRREEMRTELDTPGIILKRKREITKYLQLIPEEVAMTKYRGAYSSFEGSPASQGQLQFDLWGEKAGGILWNWDELKGEIAKYGIRNSLLLAPMPTASTSQILGFNESIEPFTSNIYQRQTLAGEFVIINKHLIKDLLDAGLWNTDMKNRVFMAGGSIQAIQEIPENIRELYKTGWEMKQKVLIDQAADRGIYVCQSQSLNLFVEDPEFSKLSNMHFYGWKRGLKTGVYYLRTRPRAKITAFTIEPPKLVNTTSSQDITQVVGSSNLNVSPQRAAAITAIMTPPPVEPPTEEQIMACRLDNPEGCLMCGS
jgi:ribonucleotide reductase alpha subunit